MTKIQISLIFTSFRGKRIQKTPAKASGYPATAWYKYTDTTCDYQCQAIEYLWWGYCAYSGIGNGITSTENLAEFKYAKKADFVTKDLALAKIYKDSESKKAKYRLPTKPVDGSYFGCAKCASGGKSHGGN